ncbi:hypothetical protein F8388_004560 [Cannabis sativa]|uniref:Uncharacterized protein n=1 Tax=Cannabis sativa TaxID=3483 RepID=A0A7J6GN75_CANSA|nr:hypothetical protein F8388_004560 [Cannabis sativa]
MGLWDYITATTDSLKNNTPDLTLVKNWCSTSYGYTKYAVTDIGGAIKDNAGKVITRYGPDEKTKSKLVPLATSVAKYSVVEGLKFVPGGVPTYNVLKKSFNDLKKLEEDPKVEVKNLEDKVRVLEKEVEKVKKLVEEMEFMNNKATMVESEKTENVVRGFMMDDCTRTHYFTDFFFLKLVPKKR